MAETKTDLQKQIDDYASQTVARMLSEEEIGDYFEPLLQTFEIDYKEKLSEDDVVYFNNALLEQTRQRQNLKLDEDTVDASDFKEAAIFRQEAKVQEGLSQAMLPEQSKGLFDVQQEIYESEAEEYAEQNVTDLKSYADLYEQRLNELMSDDPFGALSVPDDKVGKGLSYADAMKEAALDPRFEVPEPNFGDFVLDAVNPMGERLQQPVNLATISQKPGETLETAETRTLQDFVKGQDIPVDADEYEKFFEGIDKTAEEIYRTRETGLFNEVLSAVLGQTTDQQIEIDEEAGKALTKKYLESDNPLVSQSMRQFTKSYGEREELLKEIAATKDFGPTVRGDLARLSMEINESLKLANKGIDDVSFKVDTASGNHIQMLKESGAPYFPAFDLLFTDPKAYYEQGGARLPRSVEQTLSPEDIQKYNRLRLKQDDTNNPVYQELNARKDLVGANLLFPEKGESALTIIAQARINAKEQIDQTINSLEEEKALTEDENERMDLSLRINDLNNLKFSLDEKSLAEELTDEYFENPLGLIRDIPLGIIDTMADVYMRKGAVAPPDIEGSLNTIRDIEKLLSEPEKRTQLGGEKDIALIGPNYASDALLQANMDLLTMTDSITDLKEIGFDGSLKDIYQMTPTEFLNQYGNTPFKDVPVLMQMQFLNSIESTQPVSEFKEQTLNDLFRQGKNVLLREQDIQRFVEKRLAVKEDSIAGRTMYKMQDLMFEPVFDPETNTFSQKETYIGSLMKYGLGFLPAIAAEAYRSAAEGSPTEAQIALGVLGANVGAAALTTVSFHPALRGAKAIQYARYAAAGADAAFMGYYGMKPYVTGGPSITDRALARVIEGDPGLAVTLKYMAQLAGYGERTQEFYYALGMAGEFYNFEGVLNPTNYISPTTIRRFSTAKRMSNASANTPFRVAFRQAMKKELPAETPIGKHKYIETEEMYKQDAMTQAAGVVGGIAAVAMGAPELALYTPLARERLIAASAKPKGPSVASAARAGLEERDVSVSTQKTETEGFEEYMDSLAEADRAKREMAEKAATQILEETDERPSPLRQIELSTDLTPEELYAYRLQEQERLKNLDGVALQEDDIFAISFHQDLQLMELEGENPVDFINSEDFKAVKSRGKKYIESLGIDYNQFEQRLVDEHTITVQQRTVQAQDFNEFKNTVPAAFKNTDGFKNAEKRIKVLKDETEIRNETMKVGYLMALAQATDPENAVKVFDDLMTFKEEPVVIKPPDKDAVVRNLEDAESELAQARLQAIEDPASAEAATQYKESLKRQMSDSKGTDSYALRATKTIIDSDYTQGFPTKYVDDLLEPEPAPSDLKSLLDASNTIEATDSILTTARISGLNEIRDLQDKKLSVKKHKSKLSFKEDGEPVDLAVYRIADFDEQLSHRKDRYKQGKTYKELEAEIEELKKKEGTEKAIAAKEKAQANQIPTFYRYEVFFGGGNHADLRMTKKSKSNTMQLEVLSGQWMTKDTWLKKEDGAFTRDANSAILRDFYWRQQSITHALEKTAALGYNKLQVPLGKRGIFQQTFGEGVSIGSDQPLVTFDQLETLDGKMVQSMKDWLGEGNVKYDPKSNTVTLSTAPIKNNISAAVELEKLKGTVETFKITNEIPSGLERVDLQDLPAEDKTPAQSTREKLEADELDLGEYTEIVKQHLDRIESQEAQLAKNIEQVDLEEDIPSSVKVRQLGEDRLLFSVSVDGQPFHIIGRQSEIITQGQAKRKTLLVEEFVAPGKDVSTGSEIGNGSDYALLQTEILVQNYKEFLSYELSNKEINFIVKSIVDEDNFKDFLPETNKEIRALYRKNRPTILERISKKEKTDPADMKSDLADFYNLVGIDLINLTQDKIYAFQSPGKDIEDLNPKIARKTILKVVDDAFVERLLEIGKDGAFDLFVMDNPTEIPLNIQERLVPKLAQAEYTASPEMNIASLELLSHLTKEGYQSFAFGTQSKHAQYMFHNQLRKAGSDHLLEYVSEKGTYDVYGLIDLGTKTRVGATLEYARTLDRLDADIALTDPDVANLFEYTNEKGRLKKDIRPSQKGPVEAMQKWLLVNETDELLNPNSYTFIVENDRLIHPGLTKEDISNQKTILREKTKKANEDIAKEEAKAEPKNEKIEAQQNFIAEMEKHNQQLDRLAKLYEDKDISSGIEVQDFSFTFQGERYTGKARKTKPQQSLSGGRYYYISDLDLGDLFEIEEARVLSKLAREAAVRGYDGLMFDPEYTPSVQMIADRWDVEIQSDEFRRLGTEAEPRAKVAVLPFTPEMSQSLVPRGSVAVVRTPKRQFSRVGARTFQEALETNQPVTVRSEYGDIVIQADLFTAREAGEIPQINQQILEAKPKVEELLFDLSERYGAIDFTDVTFDSALTRSIDNFSPEIKSDILNHIFNEAVANEYARQINEILGPDTVTVSSPVIRLDGLKAAGVIEELDFATRSNDGPVRVSADSSDAKVLDGFRGAEAVDKATGDYRFTDIAPIREYNAEGYRQVDLIALANDIGLEDVIRQMNSQMGELYSKVNKGDLTVPEALRELNLELIAEEPEAQALFLEGRVPQRFFDVENKTAFVKHSFSRRSRSPGLLFLEWEKRDGARVEARTFPTDVPEAPVRKADPIKLDDSVLAIINNNKGVASGPKRSVTITPNISFEDFVFVNSHLLLQTLPPDKLKLVTNRYESSAGQLTSNGMKQFAQEQMNFMKTGNSITGNIAKIFEHNAIIFEQMWEYSEAQISTLRDRGVLNMRPQDTLASKWNWFFRRQQKLNFHTYEHSQARRLPNAKPLVISEDIDPASPIRKERRQQPGPVNELLRRLNNPIYNKKYEGTRVDLGETTFVFSEFKVGDEITPMELFKRVFTEAAREDYIDKQTRGIFLPRTSEKFVKVTNNFVPESQVPILQNKAKKTMIDLLGEKYLDPTRRMTQEEAIKLGRRQPFSSVIPISLEDAKPLRSFVNRLMGERHARMSAERSTLIDLTTQKEFERRAEESADGKTFITTEENNLLVDIIIDSQIYNRKNRRDVNALNQTLLQRLLSKARTVPILSQAITAKRAYIGGRVGGDAFDLDTLNDTVSKITGNIEGTLQTLKRGSSDITDVVNPEAVELFVEFRRSLGKSLDEIKKAMSDLKKEIDSGQVKDAGFMGRISKQFEILRRALEIYEPPISTDRVVALHESARSFDFSDSTSTVNGQILEELQKMTPAEVDEYIDSLQEILTENEQTTAEVGSALQTLKDYATNEDPNLVAVHNSLVVIQSQLKRRVTQFNDFADMIFENLTGKKPAAIFKEPTQINFLRRQVYSIYMSGNWFDTNIKSKPKFVPFESVEDFTTRTGLSYTKENIEKYLSDKYEPIGGTQSSRLKPSSEFEQIHRDYGFEPVERKSDESLSPQVINDLMSLKNMTFDSLMRKLNEEDSFINSDPIALMGAIAVGAVALEKRKILASKLLEIGTPEINSMINEYLTQERTKAVQVNDLHFLKEEIIKVVESRLKNTYFEQRREAERGARPSPNKQLTKLQSENMFWNKPELRLLADLIADEIFQELNIQKSLPDNEEAVLLTIDGEEFVTTTSGAALFDSIQETVAPAGKSLGGIKPQDLIELAEVSQQLSDIESFALDEKTKREIRIEVDQTRTGVSNYLAKIVSSDYTYALGVAGMAAIVATATGAAVGTAAATVGVALLSKKKVRDMMVRRFKDRPTDQQINLFMHRLFLEQIPYLSKAEQRAIFLELQKLNEGKVRSFIQRNGLSNTGQFLMGGLQKGLFAKLMLDFIGLSTGFIGLDFALGFFFDPVSFHRSAEAGKVYKAVKEMIQKRVQGDVVELPFAQEALNKLLEDPKYRLEDEALRERLKKDTEIIIDPETEIPTERPTKESQAVIDKIQQRERERYKRQYELYSRDNLKKSFAEFFKLATIPERTGQFYSTMINFFKASVTALGGPRYFMSNFQGALSNDFLSEGLSGGNIGSILGAIPGTAIGGAPGFFIGSAIGKVIGDNLQAKYMSLSSKDIYSGNGYTSRQKQIAILTNAFQETSAPTTYLNIAGTPFGVGPIEMGAAATVVEATGIADTAAAKLFSRTFKLNEALEPESFPPVVTPSGKIYSYHEIIELVKKHGINTTYVREETGRALASELRTLSPDLFTLEHLSTVWNRAMLETAEVMDLHFRFGMFLNELEKGTDPTTAGYKVREIFYDYSDLTPFERNYMRNVVTFYTFMRRNMSFMIKMFAENPNRLFGLLRFQQRQTQDQYDRATPELTQSEFLNFRFPLPFANMLMDNRTGTNGSAYLFKDETGVEKPVYFTPPLPTSDLYNMYSMGQKASEGDFSEILQQFVPPIGLAVEAGTGKRLFSNQKLTNIPVSLGLNNALTNMFPGQYYGFNAEAKGARLRLVELEDQFTSLSGKQRELESIARLSYAPKSGGIVDNIMIVPDDTVPGSAYMMYALSEFILPAAFSTRFGKVVQPFTQTGVVGKQQNIIDRIDGSKFPPILENQIIFSYNAYADMIEDMSPFADASVTRIANFDLAVDLVQNEEGRTTPPTLQEVTRKYRQLCGVDEPDPTSPLYTCIEFFERGPYADILYAPRIYSTGVDVVMQDDTMLKFLLTNFYYDEMKRVDPD